MYGQPYQRLVTSLQENNDGSLFASTGHVSRQEQQLTAVWLESSVKLTH